MADCPYARCIQERRHIRRELLRWTKNMVFVVGLERVAEELMGRRRWKQYQDTLYSSSRSETANQPHHRLYPVFSTNCSNSNTTNVIQVGSEIHQVSTGIQNQQQTLVTPLSGTIITKVEDKTEKLADESENYKNDINISPIKTRDIKIENELTQNIVINSVKTESFEDEELNSDSSATLYFHQQQRLKQQKTNENGDDEDINEIQINEDESAVKRLKLDDRIFIENSICLQKNNFEQENQITNTDKTKTEEGLNRMPGVLRVKKEEELQGLVQQVDCGSTDTTTLFKVITEDTVNTPKTSKQSETTNEFASQSYYINRRVGSPIEDWKPLDKCYFCLDGKLDHDDQPPFSPQSESSSSSRSAESPMSVQVDPMAASVVAAALSGTYPTLLPQWCLPPRESSNINVRSQSEINQPADQPLDLSAKPKISQEINTSLSDQPKIPLRMPPNMDNKNIFTSSYRPKPRLTGNVGVGGVPVVGGGRRTYTEEELQAALRDIQSGKLGTRRAAVIYGIPRSTLRNKVYKLAMERERDALSSTHSHSHDASTTVSTTIITSTTTTTTSTITTSTPNTMHNVNATSPTSPVNEVDDKELSGAEEEKEVEKALLKPLLSLEDLVRFSALEGGGDSLRNLLQRGQETDWPGFEHANIGPYIQKMLAAATPFKGLESQDHKIPEVMRRLMSGEERLNINGEQLHLNLHQSTQQSNHQPSQNHQQSSLQQRLPLTNEDFIPSIEDEASDSGQGRAILKIPSYKPAGTPGPSKNNNGEQNSGQFNQNFAPGSSTAASPGLLECTSPNYSGTSSPTNSLAGKAVTVNFRDVIAKSISSKFQEGQTSIRQNSPSMLSESNPFKRSRYTPPDQNQGQQQQQQQQQKPLNNQDKSKSNSSGKGTRPKRGKYRNYDRDSLVEAVRAVQRGEMSVHRAGSYYGVPHSTLEYKVKERHLMRPRKRDQKQADDKAKESPSPSTTFRPTQQDKKPALKTQKPFNPGPGSMSSPNGMKMPFLDGMPHLPFGHPFNFWGPTPFMPSPFIAGAPNVPTILPEQYFATQRMRGLQEQQRSAIVQQQHQQQQQQQQLQQQVNTREETRIEAGTSNSRSIVKTTREMAESLYDTSGVNGSFLDNLIRSSLETETPKDQRTIGDAGSSQHHSEALNNEVINQLPKNSQDISGSKITRNNSDDEIYRNSTSLPERPERVPTVDLSPSPIDRIRNDEHSNDRLTSLQSPNSVNLADNHDNFEKKIHINENSKESDDQNNDDDDDDDDDDNDNDNDNDIDDDDDDDDDNESCSNPIDEQSNSHLDLKNSHAVSTEKKSACDSNFIVDHSSQKSQQVSQQSTTHENEEFSSISGLVIPIQRGYTGVNTRTIKQEQETSATVVQISQEPENSTLAIEDRTEQ